MNQALANISIAEAKLPDSYRRAKAALSTCADMDECKNWADKAMALASYARQADDDHLLKYATRIQARATRRCGELLKTFNAQGQRTDKLPDGADSKSLSQRAMAAEVGMSERQQVTAVRVANIPKDQFEEVVERDAPTVTQLAKMGINAQPKPPGFKEATVAIGTLKEFAQFCAKNDPVHVAGGVWPHEVQKLRKCVTEIDTWLDRFVINLKD